MQDLVGSQLGNYRLLRLLGRGGFAEVYLGENIHIGKQTAIKRLYAQLTSEDVEQFRKEAKIIADLNHPNIVQLLDFGIEYNTPFLIMTYAPHGSLRDRHPRGQQLSLAAVNVYVGQIASALHYAHTKKIIHRDVKPENMLLDEQDNILLTDFGIATVARNTGSLTIQDKAGTAHYMSPEQFKGTPRPASDQYSLAVMVYEWLCGELPFEGENFIQLGYQHTYVAAQPLLERVPFLPSDVERVVHRALAKEPEQRFASIQAFAEALEQASRQQPVPTFTSVASTSALTSADTHAMASAVLPSSFTYGGHSDWVYALAWSPDGRYLASAGRDKAVHVWEASSGKLVGHYSGHARRVNSLAWTASGGLIASASKDRTVHIWPLSSTDTALHVYRGHTHSVNALAWSPDEQLIASGSSDKTLQIWQPLSGKRVQQLRGHKDELLAVAWSPDGTRVAAGSSDATVRIWNAATGQPLVVYRGHTRPVTALLWSGDGRSIASASADSTIQVWDAASGTKLHAYTKHTHDVLAMASFPANGRIASTSYKAVHVWQPASGKTLFIYDQHTDWVRTVAWSPDGLRLASAGDDRTVQVWSMP